MPDWEIKYFDDRALKAWVKGMFGGTRAESIWNNLPRVVLKTDVFRYMVGYNHYLGVLRVLTGIKRQCSVKVEYTLIGEYCMRTFADPF